MPQIPLPPPATLSMPFGAVVSARRSAVVLRRGTPLLLADFGTLLGTALEVRNNGTRNYPSGGALYPIEAYLIAPDIGDANPGVFHYDPHSHALERLLDFPQGVELADLADAPDELAVSALLVLTSVWDRQARKYGDFAYVLALIEAGHISQNVLLAATALGLAARQTMGFKEGLIVPLLDLDERSEQIVEGIVLAKPLTHSAPSEPAVLPA